MKPRDIKWLYKKKPKCVDCYFLTKFETDGMGGANFRGKVNSQERKHINKGHIDTWLNPNLHLACYQGVWSDGIKEKKEWRLKKITKGRPSCHDNKRFKKFDPEGPDVGKAYEEHNKEILNKEHVPIFKTPGWGWKLLTILQAIFIGLLTVSERIREWFFSLF